jgi:hypothetical protein
LCQLFYLVSQLPEIRILIGCSDHSKSCGRSLKEFYKQSVLCFKVNAF